MKLLSFVFGLLVGSGAVYVAGAINRAGRIRRRTIVLFATLRSENLYIEGDIKMFELKEGKKVTVTVEPKTAKGHPAQIEAGSGRWSTSDESVVSVEQDPANELSATVRGLDGSTNESVVLEFRADADAGEGIREVVGTASVICTQGEAAVFGLTFGTAVDDAGDVTAGAVGTAPADGQSPATNAGSDVAAGDNADPGVADTNENSVGRGDNIGSDPSLGAPNPDGVPGDPVTTNPAIPGEGNEPAKPGDDFDQRPGDLSAPMTFPEAAEKAAEQETPATGDTPATKDPGEGLG